MTPDHTPQSGYAKFMFGLWCVMSILALFVIVFVPDGSWQALHGFVFLVATAGGALMSWRFLRGDDRWAMAPAHSNLLLMAVLGAFQATVALGQPVAVRVMWGAIAVLAVFGLIAAYMERSGRHFSLSAWFRRRFTVRQRAVLIFGSLGVGLIPVSIWIYENVSRFYLAAPGFAAMVLVSGYRYTLRQAELQSGGPETDPDE